MFHSCVSELAKETAEEMVSAGMYFGRDPEALELGHDLDPDAPWMFSQPERRL